MRTLVCALILAIAGAAHADGTFEDVDATDLSLGSGDSGFRLAPRLEELGGAVDRANEQGEAAGDALEALIDMREMFEALSDLDRELDQGIGDDGAGPEVPSSCADNPDCNECFERAYGEINFVRNTLERLRSISSRTIAMIEAAEGFGDSVSGVHGVSGLAWQSAKGGIEAERRKFNKTSRDKYNALVESMRGALQQVAECEKQHYNNPDWYNRYGFMYFNFIKESYKPKE